MNISCLSTGRCGSTTFAKSIAHARNYTSGHETRATIVGNDHFNYPDFHIESDNRLSWMLGSLDEFYGDNPIYIHLLRNPDEVAASYCKRYSPSFIGGIMHGFGHGILQQGALYEGENLRNLADLYVNVVNQNIKSFLKDKTMVVVMDMANPKESIIKIWEMGKMEGDLEKALSEWDVKHNTS